MLLLSGTGFPPLGAFLSIVLPVIDVFVGVLLVQFFWTSSVPVARVSLLGVWLIVAPTVLIVSLDGSGYALLTNMNGWMLGLTPSQRLRHLTSWGAIFLVLSGITILAVPLKKYGRRRRGKPTR